MTSDQFIRVAQLAKGFTDGVGVHPNARWVKQGRTQFGHRDVTILLDDFDKEAQMQVQLALAFQPTLRSGWPVRRVARAHWAPVAGESFISRAAARPLTLPQCIAEIAARCDNSCAGETASDRVGLSRSHAD